MTKLKQLEENGIQIFPVTHQSGVLDDNGQNIGDKITILNGKIGDSTSGLTKNVADNTANIAQNTSALADIPKQLEVKMDKETKDISVYQINKNKGLIDETFLSDSLKQQINGNAPISQTIQDRSITLNKTTFNKVFGNLINKNTSKSGFYISHTNGLEVVNAGYGVTDYILIEGGKTYSYWAVYTQHFAFYDINKNYIPNAINTLANPFTAPTNAVYMRCSITNPSTQLGLGTIIEGSVAPIGYIEQNNYIDEKVLPIIPLDKIPFLSPDKFEDIPIEKVDFAETINLYNTLTSKDGYYINEIYGTEQINASYTASDWIEILPMYNYKSNAEYMRKAFYDKDKKFISGTQSKDFTTPSNAKYMRTSVGITIKNTFMLCKSDYDINIFVPYRYKIKKQYLDIVNDELLIYLPPKVYVAVGRTIELYNNQVAWCGNINNYHFRWYCTVGKNMKRKFSITGQADKIGDYPLKLYVYDNNMKQVAYAETTIKIVNNTIVTNKSILNIGDSLSNDKPWYNEMMILSNNKLSYIGTKGKQVGYKHEGRSGFSAYHYLNATPYNFNDNETTHKFWDGTRFNYNYYKTQNNINPDIVQIFLGTNGITLDATENANNIKQIIDYIRQDDANIPIYVVNTLYMGNQDGIGVQRGSDGYASALIGKWKLEEDRKVFNLMVKLNSLLQGYTNVHIIPIALTHDSEYNFGSVETSVNPRAVQKEYLPSEAVHPQEQGCMQFADCMFSTYCGTII